MSKSITITGIYNNNKRNCVGLHDPRNTDMVDIRFDAKKLAEKCAKYFAGKVFKRFEIDLEISRSNGISQETSWDLTTIGDIDIKKAVYEINNMS